MLISLTAVVKFLFCVSEHVVYLKYIPSKHPEIQVNLSPSSKRHHDRSSGLWSRGPGRHICPVFKSHPSSSAQRPSVAVIFNNDLDLP